MTAHQFAPSLPPKPQAIRCALPNIPATETLCSRPQWVAWDYVWKPDKAKWDKPPFNARNGRFAKSSDPLTWADFETAMRYAQTNGLAGVGYVLSRDDNLTGIDLDGCRNKETGELEPWADSIVALAETYAEVSPSGEGVRLFAFGKVAAAIKSDAAHVEVYGDGRYLTITGHKLPGTPDEIRPAPRTLAALEQRVADFKAAAEAAKQPAQEEASPSPRDETGQDFFGTVNSEALQALTRWVPELFGSSARSQAGTQGYRVTSLSLGRNLEEDLSITPQGIVDFGIHDMGDPRAGKRTAIDLVMEHGGAADPVAAALWLCKHLGLDPERAGWRALREPKRPSFFTPSGQPAANSNGPPGDVGSLAPDRLAITQQIAPAPEFPVQHLPAILRGAVEALEEHVQAPRSLCAHSVLGAAALAAQGLANVKIPPLPEPKPLSLFMLAIAASGERKTSCDSIALKAAANRQRDLEASYEEDLRSYKNARAAYDGERRKIEHDKSLDYHQRRAKLDTLPEPEKPLTPLLRAKEPNLEGLLNLLNEGMPSVGIFTSEGGQFLGGHGMGEEARTRTITGLSELWDSGEAQRVRAKEVTILSGRRVSISLAVQPKIASTLLGDDLAQDQGFIGRFLLTFPDSKIGQREVRASDSASDPRLQVYNRALRRLHEAPLPLRDGRRNELDLPALRFAKEAEAVWFAVAQSLEDDCRPGGRWQPVQAAALKMGENIARIAGVLTLTEDPSAPEISGETMAAASTIGLFYLQEALRLVGHDALDPQTRANEELAQWLTGQGPKAWRYDTISPSLIQRLAPNHLRGDAKRTREQVKAMVDAGVLIFAGAGKIDGKQYRETYTISRGGAE